MAKYKIEIKRSAVKEIRKLPILELKKVLAKIESLEDDPRPHDCIRLSGDEKYRVRVGDYRILYMTEDLVCVVYIIKVGHRREVYR